MAMQTNHRMHKAFWVLWPAFLMAGVLEMLVFSMVDPHDLYWLGQQWQASRQALYTVAFFAFWAVTSVGSALTLFLARPAAEVNQSATQEADPAA